jgi:hypothetical protein
MSVGSGTESSISNGINMRFKQTVDSATRDSVFHRAPPNAMFHNPEQS